MYKHWKGIFYPERLPQKDWFAFYAHHFDTVEINFTFYRLPPKKTFQSWNQRAPKGFVFAVKGSQYVTHRKRLLEPDEHVGLFFERAIGLKDHIGPILWQLPPTFRRDDDRLRAFLEVLPKEYMHTLEFRHDSWKAPTVYDLLTSYKVALCIPDSAGRPGELRLTTDWTYLRFHQGRGEGGNYTPCQLDAWAETCDRCLASGVDLWAYFNNDPFGHAVSNGRQLRERLT